MRSIRTLLIAMVILTLSVVISAQEEIDDITDNPEEYVGQTFTLNADLVEVLSPGVIRLEDDDLLADSIAVALGTETISGFDIFQLAEDDMRVQVTGEVQVFDEATFTEEYANYNIDWTLDVFDDYAGEAIMLADNAIVLEAVDETAFGIPNLDTILDAPEGFYGERITLQETMVEAVGNSGFIIEDDDFFIEEQMLVITTNAVELPIDPAQLADEGVTVRISGTLRQFVIEDIIADYNIDLLADEGDYADYDIEPVLVADEVTVIDDVADEDLSQLNVDDVTDNPAAYYGQTITLRDSVVNVVENNVFLLEDDELLNEEHVLVFYQGPETDISFQALADDETPVEFTGMLYRFVRTDFEEAFDLDLVPDLYDEYEDIPALIAEQAPIIIEED